MGRIAGMAFSEKRKAAMELCDVMGWSGDDFWKVCHTTLTKAKFQQLVDRMKKDVEREKALRWCLIQLRHVDHDCHASPDDGCSWCALFSEYERLLDA